MNIVKGVPDLIRRSSAGHTSESGVGSSSGRFLPPSPKIYFSDIGDEAILSALWGRSINALDKRAQILSPGSPFFLGSNDDKLERAQARAAARAAAVRRKATSAASAGPDSSCLDKEHILDSFHNCAKLASENKINQKNTRELSLIDHLCDKIKVDVETNFQKASCTLEAVAKLYSMRVDSVHSEAYKVLGGINRVGQENQEEGTVEDSNINSGQEENTSKKENDRKLSPLSTLESSFDALNVKKFDAAFAVDPLYHQTSAQFDEGGAKGLLLNNLGVYGGCRVLFDSLEVPANCSSDFNQHDKTEAIDISFAKECSEEMVLNMLKKFEISPSLREIVNHFDDDYKRPPDTFSSGTKEAEQVDEPYDIGAEFSADTFEKEVTWGVDQDDQTNVADEGACGGDPITSSHYQDTEPTNFHDPDTDDRYGNVDDYLFLSLGLAPKLNAWAGPEHWNFRKVKGSENVTEKNGSPVINKKQPTIDIEFLKSLDQDLSDVFAPPKNPKDLLLPTNREPCNTTLPEDCHYQPENLVKLFLRPNVMCLGRSERKSSAGLGHQTDDYDKMPSWDDEAGFADHFDDGNNYSDVDESNTLVSQPRQVDKIEVQYDRKSKQVDVQALKETLWESLRESQLQSVELLKLKSELEELNKRLSCLETEKHKDQISNITENTKLRQCHRDELRPRVLVHGSGKNISDVGLARAPIGPPLDEQSTMEKGHEFEDSTNSVSPGADMEFNTKLYSLKYQEFNSEDSFVSRAKTHKRKRHVQWSLEEVLQLVDGVSEYGVGRWTVIKKVLFSSSAHRSSVDLKDKWRNLVRATCRYFESKERGGKRKFIERQFLPKDILHRVRELSLTYPYPRERNSKVS